MRTFVFSPWIDSTGGPLVVMEKSRAHAWTGVDGEPSDYALACEVLDYTQVLERHDTQVLGDEPLATAIATANDLTLIVRWGWALSQADVQRAIDGIDLAAMDCLEDLTLEWRDTALLVFDSCARVAEVQTLELHLPAGLHRVRTYLLHPTEQLSLRVTSIMPL